MLPEVGKYYVIRRGVRGVRNIVVALFTEVNDDLPFSRYYVECVSTKQKYVLTDLSRFTREATIEEVNVKKREPVSIPKHLGKKQIFAGKCYLLKRGDIVRLDSIDFIGGPKCVTAHNATDLRTGKRIQLYSTHSFIREVPPEELPCTTS
jgi:hypothetical protein